MKKQYQTPLIILALTFFSILIKGYVFGFADHGLYLTFVLKIAHPELFPNDIYLMTLNNFPSYFYRSIGLAMKIFDFNIYHLRVMFLLAHIIFRYFFIWAFYRLAMCLFSDKKTAILSIILFLGCSKIIGAGESIALPIFGHGEVATPILLLSAVFFMKERYFLALMLVGFTVNIHPLQSFDFLAMFIFYFLYRYRKIALKTIFISVGVFFLFALPTLILSIKNPFPLAVKPLWFHIQLLRHPHHMFPFTWAKLKWLYLIGFLSLYLRALPEEKNEKFVKAKLFMMGLLFLFIIGTGASVINQFPFILRLQLPRVTTVFVLFGIIFITRYLVGILSTDKTDDINKFLVLGMIFSLFANWISFFTLFFMCHLIFTLIPVKLPVIKLKKKTLIFAFSVLACLVFISVGRHAYTIKLKYWDLLKHWREVQVWANKNTFQDKLFITPLNLNGFRLFSQRGIVSDFKSGGNSLFNPEYGYLWWERMKDFGIKEDISNIDLTDVAKSVGIIYNNLTEEQVKLIAKKYRAEYFVTASEKKYNFKLLYSNPTFKVYLPL